uniref:Uncharacterized protein n=1 Tax=Glossina austeni TaxID=7395 RepID=A0A1A9VPV5_GLOAU
MERRHVLKEEPDDFSGQLVAPNAVDACIPLDESTPLFGEMLVGLMGSYGSLLPDDINSLDSSVVSEQANKSNNNSTLYQQAAVAASTESIINPANVNSSSVIVNNNSVNSTNNNNTTNIDPFISYRDEVPKAAAVYRLCVAQTH